MNMGIQLQVKNFRCLRAVDWSPDGVCVVVGANGSGKTTLLDSLDFLRLALEAAPLNVIAQKGGGAFFKHLDAPESEGVSFSLTQSESTWELDFIGPTFNISWAERVKQGGELILQKLPGETWIDYQGTKVALPTQGTTALRILANPNPQFLIQGGGMGMGMGAGGRGGVVVQRPEPRDLPVVRTVQSYRSYGNYAVEQLRQGGSPVSGDMRLSLNGGNAFAVLRNWRDKRGYQPAYEFVISQLSNAFPGVADGIEFDFAAQVTSLRLLLSRWKESIPVTFAPHGWITGLLHLMAVAGAEKSDVVAFDEFENSLHPYAIRRLVQAMREWAAERQLTVLLTGHSSALLDEFREYPSQVFVMEPWQAPDRNMPIRLTEYRDPEWLQHFSLGELYRHEDFGGPKDAPTDLRSAS
jgi:predicted ATPase